jgi:Uma2 family endonuclease
MGWTAADLDDPKIEREWLAGRYEIVEGVLTKMPPAYFAGGSGLFELLVILKASLKEHQVPGKIGTEIDIIVDDPRVAVADAVFLTPEDQTRQAEAARKAGRRDPRRTRLLTPPTLAIESISPGHELHDRRTKRKWYAEFGVQNYWILDAFEESLQCLVLRDGNYLVDVTGRSKDEVRPSLFPGLVIPLKDIWPS